MIASMAKMAPKAYQPPKMTVSHFSRELFAIARQR